MMKLETPPKDKRDRELWLTHAAGLIIFENARQYAIDKIDNTLSDEIKSETIKGIDNALYGMMMIFDGVTGVIRNEDYTVNLETKVCLLENSDEVDQVVVDEVNLFYNDGMCMGFHGWLEGDFGKDQVIVKD